MQTILVTGGGGYIGSRFIKSLKNKYKIISVDKYLFSDPPKKTKNFESIREDTRSIDLSKINRKIDCIVDFAAISNDPSGEFFKKETFDINYKARFNLAKQAKKFKIKKYILPSSCSVYGASNKISNEKSKTNPLTNYAKANLMAENSVLKLANKNFNVIVLRFGTIFGFSPKMRLDLVLNAMTIFAYKENRLSLMKDGNQYRPLLHIQDAIDAVEFMIKSNNEKFNKNIYNVGNNKFSNYKMIDLAKLVKKSIQKKIKLTWYGDPDKRNYMVDFSKIQDIGFYCKYDAYYGINELIQNSKQININEKRFYTLNWYKYLDECKRISQKYLGLK